MSADDVTTPGTEPETVAGGESANGSEDLQAKYDSLLKRIDDERKAAAEEATRRAEAAEQRASSLESLIAERLGNNASPQSQAPDNDADEMQQFYYGLQQTAKYSQNAQERAAAKMMLGLISTAQQIPQQIETAATLAPLPENDRVEVEKLRREMASRGEQVSVKTAREMLEMRRKIETFSNQPKTPPPPPPGTSIRPVPVAAQTPDTISMEEFNQRWVTAKSADERDALYRLERAGKVRRE